MMRTEETKVVAEIVMTSRAGHCFVVQVHDNATFSNFYHWYTRAGSKPSRTSNRNNGTNKTMRLEELEAYINQHAYKPALEIIQSQVKYFDKHRYEELINMAPDQLGMVKDTAAGSFNEPRFPKYDQRLTADDRRNMKQFHRRERRKLGLA